MIKCENMKKEQQKNIRDKHVNDEVKILNLKELIIHELNSVSSSSCSGNVSFNIDTTTNHGYCEDQRFQGTIKILRTGKIKKNVYLLKIKTEFEDDY